MKFRQFLMDLVSDIRYKLAPGSKLELWLASKYDAMLDKQMDARRKAGIREIECQVFWEMHND